ncbi:MAG: hypothetical protein HYX87_05250 [Chloroflexi bacterium]|nr:hypothetical protein [Chloroflexota bacterium]
MITALGLLTIFVINILFGYWRSNTRRFSRHWIMAVHIPVLIAIGLKAWFLGFGLVLLPASIAFFTAGQYAGGRIRHVLSRNKQVQLSSFLVADVVKALSMMSHSVDSEAPRQ